MFQETANSRLLMQSPERPLMNFVKSCSLNRHVGESVLVKGGPIQYSMLLLHV